MPPRIFLIHGYVSSPAAWAPLQRELAGEVDTFAPALPGYGSQPDPATYTLSGVAEALEGALDDFQPDYLLGHSMGALLALELASRHPGRFRRVGLAGLPVFSNLDEGHRYIGSRSRARKRYMRDPGEGHAWCGPIHQLRYLWAPVAHLMLSGYPLSMLLETFNHSAEAHRGGIEDIVFAGHAPRLAAQVDAPVTLLHGDRDRVAPFETAVALAGQRGWPVRIARGAAHQVVFAQPRGAARWVRECLLAPAAAVPQDADVAAGSG